jgi:hypothetical protein
MNANLKFLICQHKIQVRPIKLSKFISSPKILNANQMSISYVLSIHYIIITGIQVIGIEYKKVI